MRDLRDRYIGSDIDYKKHNDELLKTTNEKQYERRMRKLENRQNWKKERR